MSTNISTTVPPAAKRNALRPAQVFRSVVFSSVLNGLCPFLLYTALAPHFSKGAVQPLLCASIFPLLGLIAGVVRKRMVDTIALLVLLGLSINIAAIFVMPSIKWALVARSLNGLVTATLLLFSVLIGRPLFFYVARQFATANDLAQAKEFNAINAADGGRTFSIVTLVWAAGVYSLCALNAGLALNLPPADYLLASQITSTIFIIALSVWTARFTRIRMTRAAMAMMS